MTTHAARISRRPTPSRQTNRWATLYLAVLYASSSIGVGSLAADDVTPVSHHRQASIGSTLAVTKVARLQPVDGDGPQLDRVQSGPPSSLQIMPSESIPSYNAAAPVQSPVVTSITTNIAAPLGELPIDRSPPDEAPPLVLNSPGMPIRHSAPFYSTPRAPHFEHRPLYFEERSTERDGRSWGAAQPAVSAARFFGTIPMLPYAMGARPQRTRITTGNGINPPQDRYTPREHLRGIVSEAAAATGLIYALP